MIGMSCIVYDQYKGEIQVKYRESQLIQMLLSNQNMTGNEFSDIFGVSSRTIRSDIRSINQEINHLDIDIKSSHSKGYSLNISESDKNTLAEYLIQNEGSVKNEPLYRMKSLLLELVINDELNIYDFSEKMFVSESSIVADIRYLENLFKNKKLNLKIGRRGEFIGLKKCAEKEMRIGLTLAFVDSFSELDKAVLLELFYEDILLKNIRKSVFDIFYSNKIHLSDHEYIFITTYVFVVALRSKHSINNVRQSSTDEETVRKLVDAIVMAAGIKVTDSDIDEITDLVINMNIVGKQKIGQTSLYNRIYKIADDIDRQYGTKLMYDDEFLCAITNHIESYITKKSMNINFSEDVIKEFRNFYPLSYTLAQYVKENIQDLLEMNNVQFMDKEIAFIATHFQASMEKNMTKSKVRVALVCSYGIGTTKLLETQITREFPNLSIDISIASYAQDLQNYTDIDFIISTTPLKLSEDIPWILVDVPLSEDNIEAVKVALRSDFYWTKNIYPLILDIPKELTTEKETLPYMEEVVNYIENNNLPICELLSEREKLLTTNLGHGIAMPHALLTSDLKYHIYFFKHQDGVMWGPSKVRLVALILINEESKGYLNDYMLKINKIYATMDFDVIQMDEIKNFMDIIN